MEPRNAYPTDPTDARWELIRPYVPPVNLFDLQVILVPRGMDPAAVAQPGDVILGVDEGRTPISWADKPIEMRAVTP